MGNFFTEFFKGQQGHNSGLSMGEGLANVDKALGGVLQSMTYGMAAAPKVGKSTITDYMFIISPYEDSLKKGVPIGWTYFSFEMDRVAKEFDFACHYLYKDFGVQEVKLPKGILVKGKSYIPLSSAYLRGRLKDDTEKTVLVDKDLQGMLKTVYKTRIAPLFGRYDNRGRLTERGLIDFQSQNENPTGLRNKLLAKAEQEGFFETESFVKDGVTHYKRVAYTPKDPRKYHIVITDTIRKLKKERGFTLKDTIDKWLEYATNLRNLCGMTFVHIVHLNRGMSDINRLKYAGDTIYPTPDDIKDTGNLSEECNYLFTMFSPNDDRYNLSKHFGLDLKDSKGNHLFPGMRTLHLVESREVEAPQHFRMEMQGNIKNF